MIETKSLGACSVHVVVEGTAIKDERSGETIIVKDEVVAAKGSHLWMTQHTYDEMKKRLGDGY